MWRFLVLAVLLTALGLVGNWFLSAPSHHRDWRADHSRLPKVIQTDGAYQVRDIRNWDYGADGEVLAQEWITARIDPETLVASYFVVEPFTGTAAIAHTMLAFAFADGSGFVASVEARREDGESYSAPKAALLPIFEYMVVWTTERDMYGNTVFWAGDDLYRYELAIPLDQQRAVLRAMLERTAEIEAKPRWYNTLFSNCTNVLARIVNDLAPGAVPFDKSWVLTGYADDFLYELGMLASDGSFEATQAKAHLKPLVEALFQVKDPAGFALALRRAQDAR